MNNKLTREAAKVWINQMEEMYGWYTTRNRVLSHLYTTHLVNMDDDSIATIEHFLNDMVEHGALSHIYIDGQYLYRRCRVNMDFIVYDEIKGINLKSLNRFSGRANVCPKGPSKFWIAMYPNLAKVLRQIVKYNYDDKDEFVKYGDILHFSASTGFGTPAWYDVNILTGEYTYDYIAE